MKNTEKENGVMKRTYTKMINEKEITVTETIIVKNFIIVKFEREYSEPITYIPTPGIHINEYTTKEKGKNIHIKETTEVDYNHKVINYKKEII